jgi:hypothetical protein
MMSFVVGCKPKANMLTTICQFFREHAWVCRRKSFYSTICQWNSLKTICQQWININGLSQLSSYTDTYINGVTIKTVKTNLTYRLSIHSRMKRAWYIITFWFGTNHHHARRENIYIPSQRKKVSIKIKYIITQSGALSGWAFRRHVAGQNTVRIRF